MIQFINCATSSKFSMNSNICCASFLCFNNIFEWLRINYYNSMKWPQKIKISETSWSKVQIVIQIKLLSYRIIIIELFLILLGLLEIFHSFYMMLLNNKESSIQFLAFCFYSPQYLDFKSIVAVQLFFWFYFIINNKSLQFDGMTQQKTSKVQIIIIIEIK